MNKLALKPHLFAFAIRHTALTGNKTSLIMKRSSGFIHRVKKAMEFAPR
jgi:hypothetical protein